MNAQRQLKILVLGAGMSGVLAGIKLKQAGIGNFEILEMADDVGGTWRDNTYPGLACDVPAHNYDYSFEHNWKWSGLYAKGPELKAYFKHCAHHYGLIPHLRLRSCVSEIRRVNHRWQVLTTDGKQREADIVINAMGILCHPKLPEIEGLDSFRGARFHSARWDHSVALDGQHIGVIGTGSTASQITVALAERAKHYSLFQRTPQWVAPAMELKRPWLLRQLHRFIPGYSRGVGSLQGRLIEQLGRGVTGDSARTYRFVEKLCRHHLSSVRDPGLRAVLTPDYKVGCRRLVFSDGFYKAIQAPQAELVTSAIERIEVNGVRTKDGRLHEVDVLVLATGFHALNYTYNFDVVNNQGESLRDRWSEGAEALRSVAVAGFPNYFMLIGPRSPVGNIGLTSIAEAQMGYLMELIQLLRNGRARQIDVDPEAQRRYSDYLDAGIGNTVWGTGCVGWYLDRRGKPMLYPYNPDVFRHSMRTPDLSEFVLA